MTALDPFSLPDRGVILLEASKQTYAPTRPGLAERVRRPLRILDTAPRPANRNSEQ